MIFVSRIKIESMFFKEVFYFKCVNFFLIDKRPPKDWPAKGVIIFDRVFLSYAPNEPMVLKNVNFSINSAEKVSQS